MEEDSSTNPHATAGENARFAAFSAALERDGFSPITRACYASDWWTVSEYAHRASARKFRLGSFGPDDFSLQRAQLATRGTSPATLNRRLSFLRRYSAFAVGREQGLREIADGFAAMPFQPVPKRVTKVLTVVEEERLRAAADADGERSAAIVALILGTGLRASELADLTRGDVIGPHRAPTALRIRGPRAKTVLIAPLSQSRVARILASERGGPSAPLFRGKADAALGEDGVAGVIERAAKEANLDATPRVLRHTFAVRYLAEHRDDLDGLAQALGQSAVAAARAHRPQGEPDEAVLRVRRWSEIEAIVPFPGVRRRRIAGSRVVVERELLAPGTQTPPSTHPVERITIVLSGRVELLAGSARVAASAGELVTVPAGTLHSVSVVGTNSALLLHVAAAARRA